MTRYFVDVVDGDDANDGSTAVLAKSTLNAVEGLVAAGDEVRIAPGVYRETLTVDTAGTTDTPIEYVGDVYGVYFGRTGTVRITGCDSSAETVTRAYGVTAAATKDWRSFKGIRFDGLSDIGINADGCSNWTIIDCVFESIANHGIYCSGAEVEWTIRNCIFVFPGSDGIQFAHSGIVSGSNHLIERCFFLHSGQEHIRFVRTGGAIVNGCTFIGGTDGIDHGTTNGGDACYVYNCIFAGQNSAAIEAAVLGDMISDYNGFYQCAAKYDTTTAGTHDYDLEHLLLEWPLLYSGKILPTRWFSPTPWSTFARKAGTQKTPYDLYGVYVGTSDAQISMGAIQLQELVEDSTNTYNGFSTLKLPTFGRHQMFVPVTAGASATVSVLVKREADYSGNAPGMRIHDGDDVTNVSDAGSAGAYNTLTNTFSPTTSMLMIEFFSKNEATSGDYIVWFADARVTQ